MKITVLAGSPRNVNTTAMVEAFKEGAEGAGHEVTVLNVGTVSYTHLDVYKRQIQ